MEDLVKFSVVQKVSPALIPLLHQLHLGAFNTQNKCYKTWERAVHVIVLTGRTHTAQVFVCCQSGDKPIRLQVQPKPLQLCFPVEHHLLPSRISVLQV